MSDNNIGLKISDLRKKNNMSQKQLAEQLNVSNKTISKWECGNGVPDIESVKRFCKIFNITIDEFVGNNVLSNKSEYENTSKKNNDEITKKSLNKKPIIISVMIVSMLIFSTVISLLCYYLVPRKPQILESDVLEFDNKLTANYIVSNATETFSFEESIKVSKMNEWHVYKDISGLYEIKTKVVDLEVGNNIFYIVVENRSEKTQTYMVNIYRKQMVDVFFFDGDEFIEDQQIEEGSLIVDLPVLPQRVGYTASWNYDMTKPVEEDLIVEVVYTANKYQVVYHLDSQDSQSAIVDTVTYDGFYSVYNVETDKFNGYDIDVWNTKIDGSGTDYTSVQFIEEYKIDGDLHLYAKEKTAIVYSISYSTEYVVGYDLVQGEYIRQYTIEQEIVLPVVECFGYEFIGWFDNFGFQGEPIIKIKQGTFGDIFLYAKFIDFETLNLNGNNFQSDWLKGTDSYYSESDKSNLIINSNEAPISEEYYNVYEYEWRLDYKLDSTGDRANVYYLDAESTTIKNLADAANNPDGSVGITTMVYDNNRTHKNEFQYNPLRYKLIEKGEYGYIDGVLTYYKYEKIPFERYDDYTYKLFVVDDDVTPDEKATYEFLYIDVLTTAQYLEEEEVFVKVPLSGDCVNDVYLESLFEIDATDAERFSKLKNLFKTEGVFSKLYLKYKTVQQNNIYIDDDDFSSFSSTQSSLYEYFDYVKVVDFDASGFDGDSYYKITNAEYPSYCVYGFDLYLKKEKIYHQEVTGIKYDAGYVTKENPIILSDSTFVKNLVTGDFALFVIDDSVTKTDKETYKNKDRNFIVISTKEYEANYKFYSQVTEDDDNYNIKYTLYYKYDVDSVSKKLIYSRVATDDYLFIDVYDKNYLESDYELIQFGDPNYVNGKNLYYKKVRREIIGNVSKNNYFNYETKNVIKLNEDSYYAFEFELTTTSMFNIYTSFYVINENDDIVAKIQNISTGGEKKKYIIFLSTDDLIKVNIKLCLGNKNQISGIIITDGTVTGTIDYDNITITRINETDYNNQTINGIVDSMAVKVSF